jgi:hypothetical protein
VLIGIFLLPAYQAQELQFAWGDLFKHAIALTLGL